MEASGAAWPLKLYCQQVSFVVSSCERRSACGPSTSSNNEDCRGYHYMCPSYMVVIAGVDDGGGKTTRDSG